MAENLKTKAGRKIKHQSNDAARAGEKNYNNQWRLGGKCRQVNVCSIAAMAFAYAKHVDCFVFMSPYKQLPCKC